MINKSKLAKVAEFLRDAFFDAYQEAYRERGIRLSQADLAAEWGVDPTGLSNWLNAKRAMSVENVIQLSRYVGPKIFDVNDLPALMPDDPATRKVAEKFIKADDATKQKVLEMLEF